MNIKVAMFSYYFPPQYSGAALQAIRLAKKLRERGIEIVFFTVNHDGLSETDEVEGFRVFRVKEGKGKFGEFLLWKNIWGLLKNQKLDFDIFHSHGAYLRNSFVGPLSKILGKKSLVKVTLADNDLRGLGRGKKGWLHKRFILMVDIYITISKRITNEVRGYGLPEKKIREIPFGVNTGRFNPARLDEKRILRQKVGLSEDGIMLLYVGGISKRKNVKWLTELWSGIHNNYPGFLVIVGPQSREDKDRGLYSTIKEYENRLKGKFFVMPYTEKIEEFYKMADIFILPSLNEGLPNVVLEAMASGLSCLVNRVSGAEDIIDGENGLLFDVNEPEGFVEMLFELRNKETRERMGRKAAELIRNRYSIERVTERYIKLYEELLGE
jgi:glycosyltransferase involved in cell wall biosynthesis